MRSFILLVFGLVLSSNHSFSQKKAPKLVVGIIVDQMSYDYLYRYYPNFGKNGFKRLMDQGYNFRNVTYNYVPTYTGPGHASVYTGTTPSNHGIVANDWYQREYGRYVNCVEDTAVNAIGTASSSGRCSPHFLRANTITDQLKLTYPNAKVVGVSIKDRGAILPSGHMPDGAYWYDYSTGNFISSTYYSNVYPGWYGSFLTACPISKYLGQTWELSKDSSLYSVRNDNSKYELAIGGKELPVFPYNFSDKTLAEQIGLFTATPFANTYLTDFAIAAMKGENMGDDLTTDFLAISYSTPDIVGHEYGPYSLEVEDIYYRLDEELNKLFLALDKEVGKGNYVVMLSADHAVVPVPQYLTDHKLPGGYLFKDARLEELKALCMEEFQVDPILNIGNNNVYLKEEFLNHESTEAIIAFIRKEIEKWPEVKAVWSRDQLKSIPANNWQEMTAQGYDRERSGELIYILQPGYLSKSADTEESRKGTSHGSSFNYDTQVPALIYGLGKGDVFTPYQIIDLAATLVHVMNIQRPNAMTGKPMVELLDNKK